MELIPILSTIILVATICTFILAVGAYILYKIREGKQQYTFQTKPSAVKAELVVPGETTIGKITLQPEQKRTLSVEPGITREEYTKQQQPSQAKFTPEPKEYKVEESKVEKQKVRLRTTTRGSDENKFLKYTSEGYIPTQEDRNSGELKWR
ncbi:MAG: hypothetical protein RBR74_04575 [Ignavibacteriaceae bacterium]|jgi:hypothetical protein|nr:hypothetical protein [Ignavibacteriaceae bacterium]